jgi:hypothetical protein
MAEYTPGMPMRIGGFDQLWKGSVKTNGMLMKAVDGRIPALVEGYSTSILNVSKPFQGWRDKAERLLYRMYPRQFDEGRFSAIHVGANKDAAPGTMGGFKIRGDTVQQSALYLEVPSKMFPGQVVGNHEALRRTLETKVADGVG